VVHDLLAVAGSSSKIRDGIGSPQTPRELRHEVYRKQTRPVIQTGAVVMDGIFGADPQRP
jgi:hypothetical protein